MSHQTSSTVPSCLPELLVSKLLASAPSIREVKWLCVRPRNGQDHTKRTGDQAEGCMRLAEALTVQVTVALQAQVVLRVRAALNLGR